jgi:hypothetical protein
MLLNYRSKVVSNKVRDSETLEEVLGKNLKFGSKVELEEIHTGGRLTN